MLPFTPSLAAVQPDGWALPVCFAALMFPVGCAIADLLSAEPMAETAGTDRTMHDFVAAMGAAAFVVLFYGSQGVGAGQFSAAGLGASAITHGLAAAAIFLILTIVRSLAAFRERPVYAEFWLTTCLLAAGITGVIVAVILPTLSVAGGGRYAAGVGFAVALTLVMVARGRLTRAAARRRRADRAHRLRAGATRLGVHLGVAGVAARGRRRPPGDLPPRAASSTGTS